MSFENFINIGKLGITRAIKQKLLEENISVKNFDISIWQEIMDAIKDDENLKNVYTRSTNLKDKNAFIVAKETIVQISDMLWNKVLTIVNRYNGTTKKGQSVSTQEPKQAENVVQSEIKPSESQRINLKEEYSELPFNSNGDIDFDEFTVEKLKAKYPEPEYKVDVNYEDGEYITIKNKDNKFILSYVSTTNLKNEKIQTVSFEHNGIPTSLSYLSDKFSQRTTFNIDGDKYFINIQETFDENGELIRKSVWNEDNTSYVQQEYSNGILCEETTFTKNSKDMFEITEEKNILSDKLIPDIIKRIEAIESGSNFPPRIDDIVNNILNGISPNTVFSVLFDYKESTGRNLIQDIIDNKLGLDYETQKKILTHITSANSVTSIHEMEPYFEGQKLGYELQFALKYNDKEMLKETLDKVNKDNVKFVLDNIYDRANNSFFSDYSNKLYTQLLSVLGADDGKYITNFANSMIENINEKGGYTKDIIEDWNSNLGSFNGTIINFTRLTNRCQAGQNSTITGKPDGKIDINNVQQKGTGDCWLIASVLSATNKNQKGLDCINSMLSVDSNGNVTVELKGVNKKYVISAEEIEKSNHLASGDPDMRAIEIAVDKYIKENAYMTTDNGSLDFSQADINGDRQYFAYNILFGNECYCENPDLLNEDYNSENQVYSLSFDKDPNIEAKVLDSNEKQTVDIIGRHAYAIKGSDEKYIYLINPHNSSETIQVERTLLQSKNPRIYSAHIDKS